MTSFRTAQEKGLKWPQGPDDLCPGKIENPYLYGGGRTLKLKKLLAGISAGWIGGIWALDKYLTANRANVAKNYFLERTMINLSKYLIPAMFVLWLGLPVSQGMYWSILDFSVGAKPTISRDPRPNWPPGKGLLDHAD
ncbi:hypothetical protein SteCoe_36960 [Stentor coeruleus]|uniref:Uncharacterized protein n=1 Tax=Stentor coeruleus TaxID=5963 RepID=A0A1R2AP34_9CILI|nr:hypothetical protein SteCoe_36960 [Stentor coeruleus]